MDPPPFLNIHMRSGEGMENISKKQIKGRKQMSLKNTIAEYVKSQYPEAVHKGEIGRKAILEWGYENENAGRRCRDLVTEGVLQVIYNKKGEATYRYKRSESDLCCDSVALYDIHSRSCESLRVPVKSSLF